MLFSKLFPTLVLMGRGEKETVFPRNFRLWLMMQASVCFEKLLIDWIHSPGTFETYWKLASIQTRVVGRNTIFSIVNLWLIAVFQRRGEHSWTAADRGGRQDTEETKRLCKSSSFKLSTFVLPTQDLKITWYLNNLSRDILLEDENEPPLGGGRRERRPNRCLFVEN